MARLWPRKALPVKLIVEVNGGPERETTLADLMEGASIEEVEPGVYSILQDGKSYLARVVKQREAYQVDVNGESAIVSLRDPRALTRSSSKGAQGGRQSITAPMPGKIVRVLVAVGETVEAGQGMVVVEAMKMQNEMKAPRAGSIVQVKAVAGATVSAGDILIVLE